MSLIGGRGIFAAELRRTLVTNPEYENLLHWPIRLTTCGVLPGVAIVFDIIRDHGCHVFEMTMYLVKVNLLNPIS